MVQILYNSTTRMILAYGHWDPPFTNGTLVTHTLPDAALAQLNVPGDKRWEVNETITTLPPVLDPALPKPNYGADSVTNEQVVNAVQDIRAFIANPTPTNAQTITYVKLLGRGLLFLMRRFLP